jgi:hypothetical protein
MVATLVLWGRGVFVYIKTIYINYINKIPSVAPPPPRFLSFSLPCSLSDSCATISRSEIPTSVAVTSPPPCACDRGAVEASSSKRWLSMRACCMIGVLCVCVLCAGFWRRCARASTDAWGLSEFLLCCKVLWNNLRVIDCTYLCLCCRNARGCKMGRGKTSRQFTSKSTIIETT